MMPNQGENQDIIREGLTAIRHSFRPGIQAFLKPMFFSKIIPVILTIALTKSLRF